jgi:integrin beta 2
MATSLGYLYEKDLILWADSDQGKITKIKRDGTERQTIVERHDAMDNSANDLLDGLAVDWVAGKYTTLTSY